MATDTKISALPSGDYSRANDLVVDARAGTNVSLEVHNMSVGRISSVAKNATAQTIAKGTPVYQVGVSGQDITIAPADAGDPAKMPAVAIAAENIGANQPGEVTFLGDIRGVNTDAFQPGDAVYVAVGGGYTNVPPTHPNLRQFLGRVLKAGVQGGGQILGTGTLDPISAFGTFTAAPGDPVAVYQACLAAGLDITQADIDGLFARADVTQQDWPTALERLGLQMITDTTP